VAGDFVALADLLRAPVASVDVTAVTAPCAGGDDPPGQSADTCVAVRRAACDAGSASDDVGAAMREARLFRARLADAFDEAAARLLRELACDVLGRELRLAPCELGELVQRACARAPVVRVRVAGCDVARVAAATLLPGAGVAVVDDPALAAGDAVIELAGGALDARLGVRLATVLEAFA
jgi:hypothetical protein